MDNIIFRAGNNIAIKIPIELYEETLHFYRDILLLETEEQQIDHPSIIKSTKVKFGDINLWLDAVPQKKETKIYLELNTNQMQNALDYLSTNKIQIAADEDEQSPDIQWIKDPAGNTLLLHTNNLDNQDPKIKII